jgi:hypothetical protein
VKAWCLIHPIVNNVLITRYPRHEEVQAWGKDSVDKVEMAIPYIGDISMGIAVSD